MSDLTIKLPADELAHVEAQVAEGNFDTADAYIQELIRRDRELKAEKRLEQMLLEGVEGPAVVADESFWTDFRNRIEERYRQRSKS